MCAGRKGSLIAILLGLVYNIAFAGIKFFCIATTFNTCQKIYNLRYAEFIVVFKICSNIICLHKYNSQISILSAGKTIRFIFFLIVLFLSMRSKTPQVSAQVGEKSYLHRRYKHIDVFFINHLEYFFGLAYIKVHWTM